MSFPGPGDLKSMLTNAESFSGFAVRDLDAARQFYGETLGLEVSVLDEQHGLLDVKLGDGRSVLVYNKPDQQAANFTLLNFRVPDIDEAVDGLAARGVEFERYDAMPQDEKGVMREGGPLIAWFRDPSGNILSVLQER
jgi:catechol 2,3-dioxygenase-like lactoylglutathione lyase family enzyme